MAYQLSYLIGTLVLLVFWAALFSWRKDIRREMLIISVIFGIGGLLVDPVVAIDWWKSPTLTGTIPGIESFLYGFSTAGIASVIFAGFFNRRLKIKKATKNQKKHFSKTLFSVILSVAAIFFFGVFALKLNSFQASFLALVIPTLIVWIKRRDLILNSIFSGILLVLVSLAAYHIPEIISPGWLESVWKFEYLSGITFLKIAIEDLIFIFTAGLLIGPLYEYSQETKLIKNKK